MTQPSRFHRPLPLAAAARGLGRPSAADGTSAGRRLALQVAGAAGLAWIGAVPLLARADNPPAAGKDYRKLQTPVAVPAGGKIEVIEFFWYGCPHCYALEPDIEPWSAKLPADVHYRLVPFDFGQGPETPRGVHKRVYYVWEVLGVVEAMHKKTFDYFHKERRQINTLDDMLKFCSANGIDPAKAKSAWSSFGVETKMRQGTALCDQYGVNSTPMIAVQGRFETEPAMVGQANPGLDERGLGQKTLAVTDFLIATARKG